MPPKETDEIYRSMAPEDIPWNVAEPPQILVDLIESGRVRPCKALDLGCGTGNHTIYLARRGFQVTGVDVSPKAIELAKENALRQGVVCEFICADATADMQVAPGPFDFIYDYEVLHHIYPERRGKYVRNVHDRLSREGLYLSACFSEQDQQFGGKGKYRDTPIGTRLYFSSETEMRDLFQPHFIIESLDTIPIQGRRGAHLVICAILRK